MGGRDTRPRSDFPITIMLRLTGITINYSCG
jgi:hypothetical protein